MAKNLLKSCRSKSLGLIFSMVLLSFFIVGSCNDNNGDNKLIGEPSEVPAPVPQTGQTLCYSSEGAQIDCTGTGQDGEFQLGVEWPNPRFTDNGDGTFTDNLTGLTWLENANCTAGEVEWDSALMFANTLKSGDCGLSDGSVEGDWVLPNINQVMSLIDFGSSGSPALPSPNPFMNVQTDGNYWSSTSDSAPQTMNSTWVVNIASGLQTADGKSCTDCDFPFAVKITAQDDPAPVTQTGQTLCWNSDGNEINCTGTGQDGDIQAGAQWPDPRFTDNGGGTITDNLTGLIWLKNANCPNGEVDWEGALMFANTLKSGDCGLSDSSVEGDWVLPNINQLLSLTSYGNDSDLLIATPNPFTNFQLGLVEVYWSSTSFSVDNGELQAWVYGFGSSGLIFNNKTDTDGYAIAVKKPEPIP